MKDTKEIDVVCAVMVNEGKILIARRSAEKSMSGKWEFPGGKIESDETGEQSLIREIMEEMNVEITVGKYIGVFSHSYSDLDINLMAYYVKPKSL